MNKKFVSNKDESARLFKNDIFEALSKTHWTAPLYFFIPIIIYLLYSGIIVYRIETVNSLILFFFGLLIWSATEYILHRFIFHYSPVSDYGKRLHFLFHGVHHHYPNDSGRLVMPPSLSIPLATLFYLVFQQFLGYVNNLLFSAGFLTGYLIYDILHYAIHHFKMRNKLWLFIRNHHMKHHYQNPEKGFGVSQPIWDYFFGTMFSKSQSK
ncbi:MAG: sterol desaturase family protein [Bacteroidetes bacterium]|nr:sterol desaturase family protein [Bacteroidota bacterium]